MRRVLAAPESRYCAFGMMAALDGAEPLMPPRDGTGADLHAELFQDVLDMLFDGARAQPEDGGDLAIAFAFDNPSQDFSFAQA